MVSSERAPCASWRLPNADWSCARVGALGRSQMGVTAQDQTPSSPRSGLRWRHKEILARAHGAVNRKYSTLFERLVANTELVPGEHEGGCWRWTGKTDHRGEYGEINIRVDGKPKRFKAHRVMYAIIHNKVPTPEETVEHLCELGLCINPDHLDAELISHAENSRRSILRKPRGVYKR